LETVTKKRLYEAMFLIDSADAGSDWDGVIAAITKTLERAEVDIVSITKWDDRRLAYEIKRKARGTYILRVLILCVDWMTDEDIEKDTPATRDEKEKQERAAAREAAEQAKAAESQAEASAEAEPTKEAAPAEAVVATQEAQPEQAAEVMAEPDVAEATEPVATETDDSTEAQPKVSVDD